MEFRILSEADPFHVLLLAGGLGTRLSSLNLGVPKCLAPINGRPFLEFKLRSLTALGFAKVSILTGFGSNHVEQFLGSNDFGQLEIDLRTDQIPGQGTGKSVLDAFPEADTVFVAYADSLVDASIQDMRTLSDSAGASVMVIESSSRDDLKLGNVTKIPGPGSRIRYGTQGDSSYEFVDHGLLLLRKQDVLRLVEAGDEVSNLSGMLEAISESGTLVGENSLRPYLEIGTPSSFERAQETLLDYYRGYEVS